MSCLSPFLYTIRTNIVLVEQYSIVDIVQRSTRRPSDEAGVTDYDRTVGHVKIDISTRGYQDIISNINIADDDRVGTYPYIIAYMRRTFALASELGSDDYACGYIDIMTDDALGVDDDTAEMGKIETLAYIGIIRYLKMILSGKTLQKEIAYLELNSVHLMFDAVILGDLVIVITGTAHHAYITELRARSELFDICSVYILKSTGISRISEQIRIYNVLQFVRHAYSSKYYIKIIFLLAVSSKGYM